MESRRIGEKPRGHDPAGVSCDKGDGDCCRAAVMRLYVVRHPSGEGGSASIAA